jgi:hypothetical protein
VLIGFVLIVIFILATFYGTATKVWCVVEEAGNSTKIYVAMKSSRTGLTDEKFSALCHAIKNFYNAQRHDGSIIRRKRNNEQFFNFNRYNLRMVCL